MTISFDLNNFAFTTLAAVDRLNGLIKRIPGAG
jgi:hypothetical protein